ncbi:(2Fe-2S)-binding protein [Candidatus Poribacteria bacterium]|nr:(2Fe-2S)-binding protein [Candidatus Poribacteria bacterium]
MSKKITLHVNGIQHQVEIQPESTLLSVLREELDLTGSKYGCGEGQCGACMVLVDGQSTPACVTPAEDIAGKAVTTIEGLAKSGRLHPLQEAFLEVGAMQCGYCTPGMIISGVALLEKSPNPTESEIVHFMDRNICRCGTYPRIIAAIRLAAKALIGG